MYAWKWWRENRSRIIVYLILLVVIMIFFAWIASTDYRHAHLVGGPASVAAEVWRMTLVMAVLGFGSFLVGLAGLGLGASGVGEEFAQGTVEFLLTRPRRRRYFVWAGWATGAATLFIIVVLEVLGPFLALVYVTKSVHNWKFFAMIVPLFVLGAVVYSLTYFMTGLVKSGRNGLSVSLGLIVIGLLLPVAVHQRWRIDLPSPLDVLEASKWATVPGAHFPVSATVGWALVALAFPLATQLLFERAEV